MHAPPSLLELEPASSTIRPCPMQASFKAHPITMPMLGLILQSPSHNHGTHTTYGPCVLPDGPNSCIITYGPNSCIITYGPNSCIITDGPNSYLSLARITSSVCSTCHARGWRVLCMLPLCLALFTQGAQTLVEGSLQCTLVASAQHA